MKISDFAIILQNYGWPSSSGTGTQSRQQRAPPARKGKAVPGAAATFIMQIRSRIEMIMRFPWLWVWKGSDLLSQNLPIIHWRLKRSPTHLELWWSPGVLWQGSSLAQRVFQLQSLPQASWLQVPISFYRNHNKGAVYHMSNNLPFHSRLPHFIFVGKYL